MLKRYDIVGIIDVIDMQGIFGYKGPASYMMAKRVLYSLVIRIVVNLFIPIAISKLRKRIENLGNAEIWHEYRRLTEAFLFYYMVYLILNIGIIRLFPKVVNKRARIE